MTPANLQFRRATVQDRDVILHHRRGMFRDMGQGTETELDRMVEATTPWLERALADGSYQGWLTEYEGKVVAGGGILISSWPARPDDSDTRRALILNVYTEPEFRRRGLARQLLVSMVQWLKKQGFRSVFLHASVAGRHLYEELGFVPTAEMRLRL